MCKFCDGKETRYMEGEYNKVEMSVDKGTLFGRYSAYSGDSSFRDLPMDINYCPICGKKLRKADEVTE